MNRIFSIGVDIVEIERIKKNIRDNQGFLKRIYSGSEIKYCESRRKNKYKCYASRFAAKEAVAKSLKSGLGKNMAFNEIEIHREDSGITSARLTGKASEYGKKNNIEEIKVSLSSNRSHAIAYAISFMY